MDTPKTQHLRSDLRTGFLATCFSDATNFHYQGWSCKGSTTNTDLQTELMPDQTVDGAITCS